MSSLSSLSLMELTSGKVSSNCALPLVVGRSPIIGASGKGQVEVEPMQEYFRTGSGGRSLPGTAQRRKAGPQVEGAGEQGSDEAREEDRRRDPGGGHEREEDPTHGQPHGPAPDPVDLE